MIKKILTIGLIISFLFSNAVYSEAPQQQESTLALFSRFARISQSQKNFKQEINVEYVKECIAHILQAYGSDLSKDVFKALLEQLAGETRLRGFDLEQLKLQDRTVVIEYESRRGNKYEFSFFRLDQIKTEKPSEILAGDIGFLRQRVVTKLFLKPEEVIVYNKKKGETCKKGERNSIWSNIHFTHRDTWKVINPLTVNREGLVLLTRNEYFYNNAVSLLSDAEQEYTVVLRGQLSENDLELIRKGYYARSQNKKQRVKKVQPTKVERLASKKGSTVLKVHIKKASEKDVLSLFKDAARFVESLSRTRIDGLKAEHFLGSPVRRLNWQELGRLVYDNLSETDEGVKALNRDAIEEEKDFFVIQSVLEDKQIVRDALDNIYKRPDVSHEDIESEDIYYLGEGRFKRVYKVVLRTKKSKEKFEFVIKVVMDDVEKSDSGYVYDLEYAKKTLSTASDMNAYELGIYPPNGGAYEISTEQGKRIVYTEGVVKQSKASLAADVKQQKEIETYLKFYWLSDQNVFFEDPKPDNVMLNKKPGKKIAGTVVDVDNMTFDRDASPFNVVYALMLHGYKNENIFEAFVNVFGSEKAIEIIKGSLFMARNMFSYAFKDFIPAFEAEEDIIRQRKVPPLKRPEVISVFVNGQTVLVPKGTNLLELVSFAYADLHTVELFVNNQKIEVQGKGADRYNRKKRAYKAVALVQGMEIFYEKCLHQQMLKPVKDKQPKAFSKRKIKMIKEKNIHSEIKRIKKQLLKYIASLDTPFLEKGSGTNKVRSFKNRVVALCNGFDAFLENRTAVLFNEEDLFFVEQRASRIDFVKEKREERLRFLEDILIQLRVLREEISDIEKLEETLVKEEVENLKKQTERFMQKKFFKSRGDGFVKQFVQELYTGLDRTRNLKEPFLLGIDTSWIPQEQWPIVEDLLKAILSIPKNRNGLERIKIIKGRAEGLADRLQEQKKEMGISNDHIIIIGKKEVLQHVAFEQFKQNEKAFFTEIIVQQGFVGDIQIFKVLYETVRKAFLLNEVRKFTYKLDTIAKEDLLSLKMKYKRYKKVLWAA